MTKRTPSQKEAAGDVLGELDRRQSPHFPPFMKKLTKRALQRFLLGGMCLWLTACGLAQGSDLQTTVMPFILRGVSLLGIDSVMCPQKPRQAAWDRLGRDLDPALLNTIATEISLAETIQGARDLIDGKIRGRLIVDVNR